MDLIVIGITIIVGLWVFCRPAKRDEWDDYETEWSYEAERDHPDCWTVLPRGDE